MMPVSCYRLGIDGANIVFQSKVSILSLSLKRIELKKACWFLSFDVVVVVVVLGES